MKVRHTLAIAGAAILLAACHRAIETAGGPDATTVGSMGWSANISNVGGSGIHGTATGVQTTSSETRVTVTINNAGPGNTNPWHVHNGRCGDNGGVTGPASSYPPLSIATNGQATAIAVIPLALSMNGAYYVNVHRSPADMGTIVACGNLIMTH